MLFLILNSLVHCINQERIPVLFSSKFKYVSEKMNSYLNKTISQVNLKIRCREARD